MILSMVGYAVRIFVCWTDNIDLAKRLTIVIWSLSIAFGLGYSREAIKPPSDRNDYSKKENKH
jgi:hypothetical protein